MHSRILKVGTLAVLTACGQASVHREGVAIDSVGSAPRTIASMPTAPGTIALVEESSFPLPDSTIGFVRDVALFEDGSVAVASLGPTAILIFAPDGTLRGTIGREGEGPGEFQDAFLAAVGDTLVVQDRRASRATWFSLDGTVIRQMNTACCMTEAIGMDADGRVTVPAGPGRGGIKPWIRLDPRTASAESLGTVDPGFSDPPVWQVTGPGGGFGKQVPLVPSVRVAIDGRGGFVLGWSGDYLLRRSSNGRDTLALFGRTTPDRPIMDEAARRTYAEEAARRDAAVEGLPVEQLLAAYDPALLPERPELFDAVWVDRSGRTWVQRPAGSDGAIRLDLFDQEGVLLDEVSLPAGAWPAEPYHRPVAWQRDAVAVVVTTDEGYRLLRYRVTRR